MSDLTPQIDWLARLVRHDTTSHLSNLSLIDEVVSWLEQHGIKAERIPNSTGTKSNLYAVIGPPVPGGIVLSGHTDVVPVTGQDWTSDPFELRESDGRYYGRGTCDMKGFCAIVLSLVPEMMAAQLKKPVILAFSYDEEVGCLGAPAMIEKIRDRLPAPMGVIVGEPSLMEIINGHKGIASFRTTVTGHVSHSSQTQQGVSAVQEAARLITWLSDRAARLEEEGDRGAGFVPPCSTLTVNVVHGGTQLNIMAGECQFEWDLRTLPGAKPEGIFEEFSAVCRQVEAAMKARQPGCRIETEWMTRAPALIPEEDNPAAEFVRSLTGRNHTSVAGYATEGGQFQEAGMPTVICGPGSIEQAHQADEYISLEQVQAGADFIRRLIAKLAAS